MDIILLILKLWFLRYIAISISLPYNILDKYIAAEINQTDNIKV